MIIYNKPRQLFFVSVIRQTFLGFEMTVDFRDTSPLTKSLWYHCCLAITCTQIFNYPFNSFASHVFCPPRMIDLFLVDSYNLVVVIYRIKLIIGY